MTLFEGDSCFHADIVGGAEVTDVTGAGDTVLAVFSACLAAGLGMPNATRLANCAAGVVVGKLGATSATATEIAQAADGQVTLDPWDG